MSLRAEKKSVFQLLNDRSFSIPLNQRKYVWNFNNWQELLDDILLVANHLTSKHFIGSTVLKSEEVDDGIKQHFSIIDGQQRIITLTIIILALACFYSSNEMYGKQKGLEKYLFVNDDNGDHFPIISKESNENVNALVVGAWEYLGKKFSLEDFRINRISDNKNINKCFAFYYSFFNSTIHNVDDLQKIILDIEYIEIIADNDEDAYSIFEVLNARGQELSDFDLLRNYLLKVISDKTTTADKLNKIEAMLGDKVEIFLRHYSLHKYGKTTDKKESRPYKIITKCEKGGDYLKLLDDLSLKAVYYKKMINFDACSDLEYKVFSFFKNRRQQQFRPLILGLMHLFDKGTIGLEEYEKQLDYLYRFFVCYNVIGDNTSNKIDDVVIGYSYKLENEFELLLLNKFQQSMAKRIPSYESFKISIQNVRFSNHWDAYSGSKKSENARVILEIVELLQGYTGKFDCHYNIEHCLPDYVSEDNSIVGNLCLIEESINEECRGKELVQKLSSYEKSEFILPKTIVLDDFDIKKRTEWMARILYDYIKGEEVSDSEEIL